MAACWGWIHALVAGRGSGQRKKLASPDPELTRVWLGGLEDGLPYPPSRSWGSASHQGFHHGGLSQTNKTWQILAVEILDHGVLFFGWGKEDA